MPPRVGSDRKGRLKSHDNILCWRYFIGFQWPLPSDRTRPPCRVGSCPSSCCSPSHSPCPTRRRVGGAAASEGPPAPTAPVPTGPVPSLRSKARQLRTAFHKNGSGKEKIMAEVSGERARRALASSLGRHLAEVGRPRAARRHAALPLAGLRLGLGLGLGSGLARSVASQVRLQNERLDTVNRSGTPSPAFGVSLAHLRRAEMIAVSCTRRRSSRGQCRTASAQGRNVGFGRGFGGPTP